MSARNLLVLCGGRSAEHEVALQSAINVVAAVDRGAFNLAVVGIDKNGAWRRLPPAVRPSLCAAGTGGAGLSPQPGAIRGRLTWPFPCCTAPTVRMAPSRGCWQ